MAKILKLSQINQVVVEQYKKPKDKKCLCESLHQMVVMCRIFGLLPISCVSHKSSLKKFNQEDGECQFFVSNLWKYITIFLIIFHGGEIYASYYYNSYTCLEGCSLRMFSQWIYLSCGILLSLFGIVNAPIFVETLNGLAEFLRLGLFCEGSKRSLRRFIFYGNILGFTQLLLQVALKFYILLKYTDEKGSLVIHVFAQMAYNIPFVFYFLFCGLIFVYVTIFNCFEKFLDITLNGYKPQSELKPPGMFELNLCSQMYHHDLLTEDRDFFENADFVRRLHERIRSSLLRMNRALNPQILIQVSVELLVIVMHLYAIILYNTTYDVVTEQRFLDNCLDSLFTVAHIVFLIFFLFCAQAVKSTQCGPIHLINMYTTKHLSAEEYAQLRLFAMKLQSIPAKIMAGRLFVVDIELLAPLIGSIVTYLLVALQFKLPAEDGQSDTTSYGNISTIGPLKKMA